MKKFLLTVQLFLGLSLICFGQFEMTNGTYNSFDGREVEVYIIESDYCVLNIDTSMITDEQLADTATLQKVVQRVDDLYSFYKDNLGYEPPGGNPDYGNKANVFFGGPSCGAGCGLVGSKGIEVGGIDEIFFCLKYDLNVNKDVIIGYEFGRNFFTFADKILFPFTPDTDEKNGGFAEGFASVMNTYAFDEIMTEPEQRELNETILNIKWGVEIFRAYINDETATPYNSLAKWDKHGTLNPNRGFDGWNYDVYAAYPANGLLFGIFETFDKSKMFPKFFEVLQTRPSVNTIEDALSNIAYAASFSLNKNLVPFFKNVMKFDINAETEAEINSLPSIDSRLIRDQSVLWFVSPFDSITLNLKGTNYLADDLNYRIMIDGEEFSNSKHGRNTIHYDVLEGDNEKMIDCQLVDGETVIDSYEIKIKKRHDFNVFDYKDEFYAYYRANHIVKSFFNGDTLRMEAVIENDTSNNLVYYDFIFSRDRLYRMEGKVKNVSKKYNEGDPLFENHMAYGWSGFGFSGPGRSNGAGGVGTSVGLGDTTNFYTISFSDSSNLFMPEDRDYFMNRIMISGYGISQATEATEIYFYDITDIDGDGYVDFEDDCPSEFGTNNGCPSASIITDNDLVKMNIFPNPNDGKFRVSLESNELSDITFQLVNLNGQIIEQRKINSIGKNTEHFDFSNLSKGIYHLVISSDKLQKSEKIVIQ